MVLIPKTGFPYPFPIAGMTEPPFRRRIKRRPIGIAQEPNRVSLYVTPSALRSRTVFNAQPEETHISDDLADTALQFNFLISNIPVGRIFIAPCRKYQPVAIDKRRTYNQSEDGASMMTAASFGRAFML